MKNIFAVAGVVIKELYRRKDFYVLFIVTILICLVMASVNIFNDAKIVRYLKEICLLLIWISLARHRHHHHRAADPGGTRKPHPAAAAGQAADADAIDFRKIPRLLARLRAGAALLLCFLRRAGRQPRASLAAAGLFPGRHACTGSCSASSWRIVAAGLAGLCRALVQFHHLLRDCRRHFVCRAGIWTRWRSLCANRCAPSFTQSISSSRIWNFSTCATWSSTTGR